MLQLEKARVGPHFVPALLGAAAGLLAAVATSAAHTALIAQRSALSSTGFLETPRSRFRLGMVAVVGDKLRWHHLGPLPLPPFVIHQSLTVLTDRRLIPGRTRTMPDAVELRLAAPEGPVRLVLPAEVAAKVAAWIEEESGHG
ncbi:DUF2550 family protein [Glycomyces sp. NRRL B-16210]|uniref:DUF2550 family protein n=1 Tax=Glycomyces sp. NRRL B-16210 TaxID=1463821 RepID=UPI0004BEE7CA|nr:DUF2550 family protein [Glycomyces sp. NRRL B-16210]